MHTLSIVKTSKNGKKWIFLETFVMKRTNYFLKKKEGCKEPCVKSVLADLFRIQYLFEKIQTSLTVINSDKVVKSGYFEKCFAMESTNFFKLMEGYSVFFVKIIMSC